MKVVVDTSVIVDYLRTKDLKSLFVKIKNTGDIVISLITVAELYCGKSVQEAGPERETLEGIAGGAEIMIPDLKIAKSAGYLRAKYQSSLADAFIASLAIEMDLPLATLDK